MDLPDIRYNPRQLQECVGCDTVFASDASFFYHRKDGGCMTTVGLRRAKFKSYRKAFLGAARDVFSAPAGIERTWREPRLVLGSRSSAA